MTQTGLVLYFLILCSYFLVANSAIKDSSFATFTNFNIKIQNFLNLTSKDSCKVLYDTVEVF